MTVVYGIVPAETRPDGVPAGIGGAPVGRVVPGGLAALVSPVEGEELRATRRDLLSHSAVLERAIAAGPVLPLRFGIVLRDEDAVAEELLEPRHDELTALLERFERLVELRVKAFYDEEAVLRGIVRSDPAIARLNEETRDAVVEDGDASLGFTASFLVDRGRVGAFDAAMDELAREHEGRITFKYLGPLPPHSFVSLQEDG